MKSEKKRKELSPSIFDLESPGESPLALELISHPMVPVYEEEIPQASIIRIVDMNEDVIRRIFENFDLQPGSQTTVQTRKDLLSAAKACKTFAEPALDALWRVLPSMLPLLLLLPSAEVVNGQYFVDNLSFNNWERFEVHARRVRTLYMETPRVVISPMIHIHIRSMRDNPLLPGLTAIYIPDNLNNVIDLPSVILLALGVSLDTVELNNSAISERSFFIPFLTSLASKSPRLSHLSLRGSGNTSLEPVYRFTSLQRLEIRLSGTYLYPQTLRRLGSLVNLSDLTLDVSASIPAATPTVDRQVTQASTSSYFRMLRRLHITGIPSSITRVLDDINLANLTAVVIDEASDNTRNRPESFWKRFFDHISMCQAIEDIEINQLTHRNWGHEYYSLSTSWFMSLLTLHNVKSLVINGSALSGDDEDFRSLARAFPKLKKLIVPPTYYSKGRTLACLFYFSRYCPELQEIKICIGYDIDKNIDAIKKLPHFIPVNHLEKLYINSSFGVVLQSTDTIQVAEFLEILFPHLSVLETYDSNRTEDLNWAGIQKFRLALKAARIRAYNRAMSYREMDTRGGGTWIPNQGLEPGGGESGQRPKKKKGRL